MFSCCKLLTVLAKREEEFCQRTRFQSTRDIKVCPKEKKEIKLTVQIILQDHCLAIGGHYSAQKPLKTMRNILKNDNAMSTL